MIVKEYYDTLDNGVRLFKHYSDSGLKIKQIETGDIYTEAIDIENAPYTYEETNESVEVNEENAD